MEVQVSFLSCCLSRQLLRDAPSGYRWFVRWSCLDQRHDKRDIFCKSSLYRLCLWIERLFSSCVVSAQDSFGSVIYVFVIYEVPCLFSFLLPHDPTPNREDIAVRKVWVMVLPNIARLTEKVWRNIGCCGRQQVERRRNIAFVNFR